jgi:dipeptidase E
MKRKIIAIGGGRVNCPRGRIPQTLDIDREVVRLAGKSKPRLLFIPTASLDDEQYCNAVKRLYQDMLGCRVTNLLLYRERPQQEAIATMIADSDIIYVGGGNTLRMLKLWRKLGVDNRIDTARSRGAVLCGVSAGAICWFRQGNSDSRKFTDDTDLSLIKVSGLGFVDALACPHYDVEKHRKPALREMMRTTTGVAIAMDNCAAIEIVDDKYRVLTSAQRKNIYRVYWKKGRYYREQLARDGNYRDLEGLLCI